MVFFSQIIEYYIQNGNENYGTRDLWGVIESYTEWNSTCCNILVNLGISYTYQNQVVSHDQPVTLQGIKSHIKNSLTLANSFTKMVIFADYFIVKH